MLRRTRLTGPALELVRRRVVMSVLLCWVPLALPVPGAVSPFGEARLSFFRDIETHVRFLVSLPVLILAEMIVHQRIRPVVKAFIERRVVTEEELPKVNAAIDSAMRIRNSAVVEVTLLIFVFTVGTWIWRHQGSAGCRKLVRLAPGWRDALYYGGVLVCVCQHTRLPVHPVALVYADYDLVLVSDFPW